MLLGGVTGVAPAKVVIIGGGTVGVNAAKIAVGLRARVIILDMNADRLAYLDDIFGGRVETVLSNEAAVEEAIGGRRPGRRRRAAARRRPGPAPGQAVDAQEHEAGLGARGRGHRPGRLLRDLQADHAQRRRPIVVDGVIHYCVANMPGAVARTSTLALTGATLPYGVQIATKGFERGRTRRPGIGAGRERLPRQAHHPLGGRGAQPALHAA